MLFRKGGASTKYTIFYWLRNVHLQVAYKGDLFKPEFPNRILHGTSETSCT